MLSVLVIITETSQIPSIERIRISLMHAVLCKITNSHVFGLYSQCYPTGFLKILNANLFYADTGHLFIKLSSGVFNK